MPKTCMMKRKYTKELLILGLSFLVLLVLSYGYPVTGDDWFFTRTYRERPFLKAFLHAWQITRSHTIAFNGRYLGNYIGALMGCNEIVRQLVRSAIMLLTILCVCRMSRCRSFPSYCGAFLLTVCLPVSLYAQTYAWSAGFFNYVPSAILVLLYLPMLDDPGPGKAKQGIVPFFLGLCTQFFSENITVGMLLAAVLLFVLRWRKAGFSPKLFGHLLGLLLGCVLMFLAPGYRTIGTEADVYRSVATGLSGIVSTALRNAGQIADYLIAENWGLLALITSAATLLLIPSGGEMKRKQWILMGCLLLPCAYFVVDARVLKELYQANAVQIASTVLTCLMTVIYLLGLVGTVLTLGDLREKRRIIRCLAVALLLSAPLLVVSPVTVRCVYTSYILLACVALLLLRQAVQRFSFCRRQIGVAAIGLCLCAVLSLSWISLWNGKTEATRIAYTEALMEKGAIQITLPGYPYQDYLWGVGSEAITDYYNYENPGDIRFYLVPYEQWNWEEFYSLDIQSVIQ